MVMLFWNLAAMAVAAAAVLIALVPARWLFRTMLLWLASPLPIYSGIIIWETSTRPTVPHLLSTALLGFSLMSAFLLVPWVMVSVLGFLFGFLLRGMFRRKG